MTAAAQPSVGEGPERFRWLLLTLYLFVTGGSFLVSFSVGVMLPDMAGDLRLSAAQQGMIGAAGWLGAMLFYLPLTAFLTRYSPVKVTTGVTALGVALILLQAWAPSFELELLGRFLFVITWIAQGPARTLLIQQWFRRDEVALVNGLTMGGIGVAEVAAIWGTPYLMGAIGGWREALVVYAAISGSLLVAWVLLAREHHGNFIAEAVASQSSWHALRSTVRRLDVFWLLAVGIGSSITWSAYFTFWPSYVVDTRGLELEQAGFIWGLGSVTLALAAFVAGPLSAALGRKPLIWAPGVLTVPLFLALLSTDSFALLALYSAALGLCWISLPVMQTVPFELARVQPREIAMVYALLMVSQNAGTTIGPLFAGSLGEFTPDLTLPLALSVIFMAFTILGGLRLPETGRGAAREGIIKQPEGATAR